MTAGSLAVSLVSSGTYQGQWQRGFRHGYGVRTSSSFGAASSSKSKAHHQSSASLRSEGAGEPTAERDRRMADTRGGFVLKARSDEPPPRRGSLVEKSTTLRKNILQVSATAGCGREGWVQRLAGNFASSYRHSREPW